jgi:transcriptional regulator with XRE-family HTH domain
MKGYAGFRGLSEYIERRLSETGHSKNSLSEALGWTHSYIAAVTTGSFVPSRKRADAIAKFFGDDPRIIRVLAGLEMPPPDLENDPGTVTLLSAYNSLPVDGKRELEQYAQFLRTKYKVSG